MIIAIVQLSDLHVGSDLQPISHKLPQLAASVCSTDPLCSHFILVLNGDIAQSGQHSEYELAQTAFTDLSALIKRYRPAAELRWVAVPGNHDCYLPESEKGLRATLIRGIQPTLQTTSPDRSILDLLLSRQQDYFSFCDSLGLSARTTFEKISLSHIVGFENTHIQFHLYNTALLSNRPESQTLSLPLEAVRTSMTRDPHSFITVGVLHHPYQWLESNMGVEFRRHIESTCDIVLTGHQHFDHAYTKETLAGPNVLYSEGDVLNEPKQPASSGFRVIFIDTAQFLRRVVSYKWKASSYAVTQDTEWQVFSRALIGLERLYPSVAFSARLSDSGIGLTHKTAGRLPLEAVFVYPDVSVTRFDSTSGSKEVAGGQLLQFLTQSNKAIIQGAALSGKTSLAKTIAKDWLSNCDGYPLILNGSAIKRTDQSSLEGLIKREVAQSYAPESVDQYVKLPSSAKFLIIDDWDDTTLSSEEIDKFLTLADAYFGKIVLLVESLSYIQRLLTKVRDTEALLQFQLIMLNEMSYVARGQMIERWLGFELARDNPQFSRRVENSERLINTVIGKNTLPSQPFIVLALLQAAQAEHDVVLENGSFGYLYEVLITGALNVTSGQKAQLDKKYTFLSLLAYRLFQDGIDMLAERAMDGLLEEYARTFMVRIDKQALLGDLADARVLSRQNGNYSFAYPHFFHYFLARYFKNNIQGTAGATLREQLRNIFSGLNVSSNRTFLMFFIYLTHDEQLTDELIEVCDRILADVRPSDLRSDITFYSSKGDPLSRDVAEPIDLDASRTRRRQAQDVARRELKEAQTEISVSVDCEPYSDEMPPRVKSEFGWSCIEMLGQILRNFAGSLPGEQKLRILRSTYLLGLRIMAGMLESLTEVTESVRSGLAERDENSREHREFARNVERFLIAIGPLLGSAVFRMLSVALGSPEIDLLAYDQTLISVGKDNATQLLDLTIKLDHSESYPFSEIKALHYEFRDSEFADAVLRQLVVSNMHVFDIGREMRQRVLSMLNVRSAGDAAMSRVNKRFKRAN